MRRGEKESPNEAAPGQPVGGALGYADSIITIAGAGAGLVFFVAAM